MTVSLAEIERLSIQLTVGERAKLAVSLLESVRPRMADVEAAWADEVESRVAAFDRGETQAFAAEDVFAQARSLSR